MTIKMTNRLIGVIIVLTLNSIQLSDSFPDQGKWTFAVSQVLYY